MGNESTVATLHSSNSGKPVRDLPYAELWMGTHPSGPSSLASGEKTLLKDWIKAHPDTLGEVVHKRWGAELPYLFKILSVATALSIQAHPDKKLAEKLHADRPNVYKDDNHKPEMAVAISEFEALSGFVTTEDLVAALESVPELKAAVGEAASAEVISAHKAGSDPKAPFKEAFTKLMTCEPSVVAESITTLVARLKTEKASRELTPKESLILRINDQYPKDVGVLSAYFLNYVVLAPGEAVYMAANEPHAYLYGECAEVMATSDNVVRAGLTPKLRDTDILCSMLTYNQGLPEILRGEKVDECTKHYRPPFDEFAMDIITVPAAGKHTIPAGPGAAVLLVFKGEGSAAATLPAELAGVAQDPSAHAGAVGLGQVFFLPAGASVKLEAKEGSDLCIMKCMCSPRIF